MFIGISAGWPNSADRLSADNGLPLSHARPANIKDPAEKDDERVPQTVLVEMVLCVIESGRGGFLQGEWGFSVQATILVIPAPMPGRGMQRLPEIILAEMSARSTMLVS